MGVSTMSSRRRGPVAVELVLGRPADQELHQRLGDAGVRVVHAHVVGVVGTPAQRQLRHVAGADDEAVFISRLVRMRACTFSKTRSCRSSGGKVAQLLRRAVGVQPVQIDAERPMAEGAHLFQAERANVDLASRHAEVPHQRRGVAARPAGGAEAGHRERLDDASAATPSRSNVLQATSRASVESSPPETPMATRGLPICSSRLARPATCV